MILSVMNLEQINKVKATKIARSLGGCNLLFAVFEKFNQVQGPAGEYWPKSMKGQYSSSWLLLSLNSFFLHWVSPELLFSLPIGIH